MTDPWKIGNYVFIKHTPTDYYIPLVVGTIHRIIQTFHPYSDYVGLQVPNDYCFNAYRGHISYEKIYLIPLYYDGNSLSEIERLVYGVEL